MLIINALFCMINGNYVTKLVICNKITLFLSVSAAFHWHWNPRICIIKFLLNLLFIYHFLLISRYLLIKHSLFLRQTLRGQSVLMIFSIDLHRYCISCGKMTNQQFVPIHTRYGVSRDSLLICYFPATDTISLQIYWKYHQYWLSSKSVEGTYCVWWVNNVI